MRLEGYSNYEIYPETGKVWSYKSNRYIGNKDYEKGYHYCTLYDDNNKKVVWRLHRLIYTTVYGEIPDGMQVNHIDEDKSNNRISNLNLMTQTENINWGTGNDRRRNKTTNGKCSKSILCLENNNIVRYFPSLMEAERSGFGAGNICNCCKGKLHIYKGYQWQYVDNYLADWWEQEMEKVA